MPVLVKDVITKGTFAPTIKTFSPTARPWAVAVVAVATPAVCVKELTDKLVVKSPVYLGNIALSWFTISFF